MTFVAAVQLEFKVAADGQKIRFVWMAGQIRVTECEGQDRGAAQGEPVTLTEDIRRHQQVRYQG
jgi:hypothetical protein